MTDSGKSPLSPSQTWSPHTAALHRRRKMGEKSKTKVLGSLGGLDLNDDDDDMFLKKASSKSPVKKSTKASIASSRLGSLKDIDPDKELRESLEKVTPEVRSKLAKVFNKNTPMKERLQLEVDMMKDDDERKILAEFRYKVERKNFNVKILESEEAQQDLLAQNLAEEAKRQAEEDKEFAKRRQERIEEEIAKKEREAEIERQVKMHKARNIAMGAEELRKEAEKTAEAALRNKKKKEQAEKEREERIQEFINGEGKHMTDVERELKIARLINSGEF